MSFMVMSKCQDTLKARLWLKQFFLLDFFFSWKITKIKIMENSVLIMNELEKPILYTVHRSYQKNILHTHEK